MHHTILLVEDDVAWYNLLSKRLERKGYRIVTATSYKEAKDVLEEHRVDVAVLDLWLPDLGNRDLLDLPEAVCEQQIPVVIVTAHASPELIRRAFRQLNITDLIDKKKFDIEEFLKAVQEALVEAARISAKARKRALFTIQISDDGRILVRSRGAYNVDKECGQLDVSELALGTWRRRANNVAICLTHNDPRMRREWRFQAKTIGRDLFGAVFERNAPLYGHYLAAKAAVARSRNLSICFQGSRKLLGVPFELLFDELEEEYLGLEHPLYRAVSGVCLTRTVEDLVSRLRDGRRRLRILLIASNTRPRIDGVDEEIDALQRLVAGRLSGARAMVKVVPTDKASFQRVKNLLNDCTYHLAHYAGHGRYSDEYPENSGMIFWERDEKQGDVKTVSVSALKDLLQDSEDLLFLYLSCCLSGRTAGTEELLEREFLGAMDAITRAGVPAVLAYRWYVSDDSAQHLAISFYESLFNSFSPEEAILDARRAISRQCGRDDETWASSMLVLQAP
jgi:CheY-like chemotaxis protein